MTEDEFINTIERHKAIIIKICASYTRRIEDRKDLFSEITLQLWRSINKFKGDSELGTWIFRVSLNTAMNYKRKTKSGFIELSITKEIESAVTFNSSNDSPWIEQLYECINLLDKFSRGLILLHLEGYSYVEIAEIIGISHSNVGTKLSRIRIKLKDIYSTIQ